MEGFLDDGLVLGCIERFMNGMTDKRTDGWMNGWTDGDTEEFYRGLSAPVYGRLYRRVRDS